MLSDAEATTDVGVILIEIGRSFALLLPLALLSDRLVTAHNIEFFALTDEVFVAGRHGVTQLNRGAPQQFRAPARSVSSTQPIVPQTA